MYHPLWVLQNSSGPTPRAILRNRHEPLPTEISVQATRRRSEGVSSSIPQTEPLRISRLGFLLPLPRHGGRGRGDGGLGRLLPDDDNARVHAFVMRPATSADMCGAAGEGGALCTILWRFSGHLPQLLHRYDTILDGWYPLAIRSASMPLTPACSCGILGACMLVFPPVICRNIAANSFCFFFMLAHTPFLISAKFLCAQHRWGGSLPDRPLRARLIPCHDSPT